MIDIKKLRDNFEEVEIALKRRGFILDKARFQLHDNKRKDLQVEVEYLKSEKKKLSVEFGKLKSSGEDVEPLKQIIDKKNEELEIKDTELQNIFQELDDFLLSLPNIPDESVPDGNNEVDNVVVSKHGSIESKNTLDHLEITKDIDIDLASKIAGSRFSVLKGDIAKLQRALISFMIDNAIKNGYEEYYLPFIANKESLTSTGQLPKFEDDLFKVNEKLYLIPTAEVPLTNLFRDQFLEEKKLPLKVTSHTPCFRSEAGSYGQDTRGLIRQHQFEKIELVQITNPSDSMNCLKDLLLNACEILELLELPYQIIELCSGDLGFSSAKTFDIEVWIPSQNKYREISSCSNFTDFQSRRGNIKFKNSDGNHFVHTINGSGLAVGRTLIALIENRYDGSSKIELPKCLQPYLDSLTISL